MGRYDIPASVDYVLNITRQSKLAAYFGYSLGCSAFFMGASDYNSRLNDQVDIMIGLGPSASVAHLNNYFRYVAPFVKLYQVLNRKSFRESHYNISSTPQLYQRWAGIGEVHTNDGVLHTTARFLFETSEFGVKLGRLWISQIFGYSDVFDQVNTTKIVTNKFMIFLFSS